MIKKICRYIAGVLFLLLWGYILVKITLLSRYPAPYASYNLKLFWCLEEAWRLKESGDWYFIVGNMLLFMPFGLIIPICFECMRKLIWTGAAGLAVSSAIEVIQLIYHRGLFEFDDIFNNTVGALLGYGIFILVMSIIQKEKVGTKMERLTALSVWITVVIFYTYSVWMGQPVFDELFTRMKWLLEVSGGHAFFYG